MKKIYTVKYVDAYYIYEKRIGKTKLSLHEAHGYVERRGNNIIIIFIKKRKISNKKTIEGKENIVEGLVIPDTALVSVVDTYKTDILKNITIGSSVSVTWRDVVYVTNTPTYDCPIMYTEGILTKIKRDHIVLKDPETIRVYPTPVRNHPGRGLPTYLMIPISFITDITVIK